MKPPLENNKWIRANKGQSLSIEYYDKEGNKLMRRFQILQKKCCLISIFYYLSFDF